MPRTAFADPGLVNCQFGRLLRQWWGAYQYSQFEMALSAEVSPRHLSFIETGRATPSREMVLRLSEALDLPLRARNELLVAAGYAPVFPQSAFAEPPMEGVKTALDFILRQQDPIPRSSSTGHGTSWGETMHRSECGRPSLTMLTALRPG